MNLSCRICILHAVRLCWVADYNLMQWFSNFLKITTLRSPKIFFYHGPLFLSMNFNTKSSEEQKKGHHVRRCPIFPQNQAMSKQKKVITSADVQSSTIQWNGLSEIRNLFAVFLKLLRTPQGDRDTQFENQGLNVS